MDKISGIAMNLETIFNVNYEDFVEKVVKASYQRPILVDIWADWCPPCLVLAPVLERLINDYEGSIFLAKVDIDEGENMKIAGQYKVRGFPTVILFFQGEEKGRFSGAKTQSAIESFIEDLT